MAPFRKSVACVSCDALGDFYQPVAASTFCQKCPANTMRYVGAHAGVNKSSCQCSQGAHILPRLAAASPVCHGPRLLQATTPYKARPARWAHCHFPLHVLFVVRARACV
jgi:hypothetical protein